MITIGPEQGWECPKCHSVYSPTTAQCLNCPAAVGHVCDFDEELPFPMCRICGTMRQTQFTFAVCAHDYPLQVGTVGRMCYKCGAMEQSFTFSSNMNNDGGIYMALNHSTPLEEHA